MEGCAYAGAGCCDGLCCVCSARMRRLPCIVCFWDGLGSADKVSFNKIKYLKLKENFSFMFSSSVEFYKQ